MWSAACVASAWPSSASIWLMSSGPIAPFMCTSTGTPRAAASPNTARISSVARARRVVETHADAERTLVEALAQQPEQLLDLLGRCRVARVAHRPVDALDQPPEEAAHPVSRPAEVGRCPIAKPCISFTRAAMCPTETPKFTRDLPSRSA